MAHHLTALAAAAAGVFGSGSHTQTI